MQGFQVRIDEHGDALGNFSLLSLQTVIPNMNASQSNYYPLNRALQVSAYFEDDERNNASVRLRMLDTLSIPWPNHRAPDDEPKCGFYDEKCLPEKSELFD